MRVFIPTTLEGLRAHVLDGGVAHARTAALEAVMSDEEEVLDAVAMLAAADDSLRLIIADSDASPRRVVVAADADARQVDGALPTEVSIGEIEWDDVVAIFVDEEEAESSIEAARAGGDDEFEVVAELDMLWFDPSERSSLVRD